MMQSSIASGKASPDAPLAGPSSPTLYEFLGFQLDPANRLLMCAGKGVALPGRAFDVLLILARRPGELLTKEELLDTVWGGSFVEESNLTVAISTLRRALNEDPHDRRCIQTVARRGYRFIADVREVQRTRTPPPTEAQTAEPAAVDVQSPATPLHRLQAWPLGLLVVGLLAVMACGCWYLLRPRQSIRTLAVLPIAQTGSAGAGAGNGGYSNEIVLLGMTDGLIQRLDGELIVRPTGSVLRYSDAGSVDAVAAGREQDVDAVLTGSLESSVDRRILKLRLIRVRDGVTLWQQSFTAGSNDLSRLVQDAGNSAARQLHRWGVADAKPAKAETTLAGNPALARANDPAYQLYLRGRYFWNRRTVDGLHKSTEYFREAIDADPNYAPAYAGLADSYALLASFSVEPGKSSNADARSAAFSAIQLDPTLAEPHASLGMIYFFTDWKLDEAEREFERAIQLNPNYATAHHWYALDLAAMGRFPQALYEIHLAQKLDPLSLIIGTNVGWIEYLARDYAAATHDLHRVLELDPNFVRARTRLGMVEMATGDYAAAIADLQQALRFSGDEDPWVVGLLGDAQARSGNRAAAQRDLDDLRRRSATQYVPPISRGLVLVGLQRKPDALVALAQAVDDHSTSMVYARVDPSLDSMRDDAGFRNLLAQIKP